MEAQIRALQRDVDLLPRQRIRDEDRLTAHIQHEHDKFRELVRTVEAGPQDRPADAEIEAYRTSRNGDDSHDSRTGSRRTERAAPECTYKNFLKCQPFNFKGTEGVTISHDVAYGMPWKTLKKMMIVKYCSRGEIKKLEIELWNLKVKDEVEKAYTVGSGEKKVYRDPNLCALNATTIMMGSVLPSAPTVRGLAILPETIEANLLLPTTKEPQGQIKGVSGVPLLWYGVQGALQEMTVEGLPLQEGLPEVKKQESGKSNWQW
ncbi:hypothetical protein Tco_0336722 [Tanacetum coccineum]